MSTRIETNHMLMKYLGIDFNSIPVTPEEEAILKLLEANLDMTVSSYIDWVNNKLTAQERSKREREIFADIEEEVREIYRNTGEEIDGIIEQIYLTGEAKGYNDIRQVAVYTPASEQALQHCKNYVYDLVKTSNQDFIDMIQEEIFVGLATDKHPYEIASNLLNSKFEPLPGGTLTPLQRARMIARTETARAQTWGTMQAYANYGVEQVDVVTAGDDNVCAICIENEENNPHDLEESTSLVPAHPNCRCAIVAHRPSRELQVQDEPTVIDLSS